MKQKQSILLTFVLFLFFLSACKAEHTLTFYEIGNLQGEIIIKSIQEKEAAGIKALFCPHLKKRPELEQEIKDFFAFIKGEIISYDEPGGSMGGGRIPETEELSNSI